MKCALLDLVDRASLRTRPQKMALKAVSAWICGFVMEKRTVLAVLS